MKKKHRILSIDGGGLRGAFPASFLAETEIALSLRSVAEYFDLIAGTSVGGILALGLGLGLSAQEMREFFLKEGPLIFAQEWGKPLVRLVCGVARYDPRALGHSLEKAFGTKLTAVEIAMATAAPPTYFPSFGAASGAMFVDGGLWANNPVALAVTEGIGVLRWNGDEIDVLSLGCTEETVDFEETKHRGLFWRRQALGVAMRGQSRSALGMARHLTGRDRDLDNIVRIDPAVASGRFRLDSSSRLRELRAFGHQEARQALPHLKDRFFAARAEPFEPEPSAVARSVPVPNPT